MIETESGFRKESERKKGGMVMKKRWLSLLPVLCMMLWVAPVTALADAGDIAINETNFPDEKFRGIVKTFDTDSNDILSKTERDNVIKIECNNKGIQSLEGIAYFEKLDSLKCTDNELTTLDVSGNPLLYELHCWNNQLTGLDLDANTKLWYLYCSNNKIDSLDVSKNVNLMKLSCASNKLTSLDLTSNPLLGYVECQYNALTTLKIGTNAKLLSILCNKNQLTSLDVSLASNLETLVCSYNALTDLDVSMNPKLKSLRCDNNQLTELDVSKNTTLGELHCFENQLTSLDVSNCASTIDFECYSNFYPITFDTDLKFDLSGLPGGFNVGKSSNWVSGKVTGSILTPDYDAGYEIERIAYDYDCGHGKTAKFNLDVSYNHMYDGNWSSNATHHWKQCTNPKCPNRIGSYKDYGTHVYDDAADTICNDCGYNRGVTGHTHTYSAWTHDTSKHWKECTVCKVRIGETAHTYDSNGTCTTCGYKKPSSGGSWKQNQNGWWYQYTNGTWPSNSWVKLPVQGGEAWYYFNKDGYMATGWLFENKNWYYLDPQTGKNNGRMMTGWQQIGGQWYYFKQNGSMATGWNYINKNWYYFSTDKLAGEGSMYADRMTPDGFYVNKDGVWVQ